MVILGSIGYSTIAYLSQLSIDGCIKINKEFNPISAVVTTSTFMKTSKQYLLLGTSATIIVGGISIVFIENNWAKYTGILLILIGTLTLILLIIYNQYKSLEQANTDYQNHLSSFLTGYKGEVTGEFNNQKNRMESISTSINTKLDNFSTNIITGLNDHFNKYKEVIENTGIENDAKFIKEGFIGLQKKINTIENSSGTGDEFVRMAVLGHLPSYMRLNDLTIEMGRKLYSSWEPPYLVTTYIQLVNQRKHAFNNFMQNGGVARDIFLKQELEDYVRNGCTFHDSVEDPVEEIEERINALLRYIEMPSYWICLLDEHKKTPNYIMKEQTGIVIDLRTTELKRHFTDSIDGLYSSSPKILHEFRRKFQMNWPNDRQSDKNEIKKFLRGLLNNVQAYKNKRDEKRANPSD